ncbi:hypothetical protein BGZ58_000627 [Dissophora ornata]|nr:hypothetical protein BGZ58_000627 [Dissophora ornata]
MSATPMDLDALRAKVVMSRKQMTQNTPPAPTPADQPSQTSTPTTNTGTVATTTTDPDIIPCLMRTPQDLEPMNPITHLTFSAPTASSSLTTAATRVNSTDTIRSSDNAPATRVQTSHIVLPDKEDGEISDEEVENTSTIAPFIPTGKDPQNDLSQPDVIAQDAMEITLTPLAIPTQPSHPSHQTAREKVVANAQWSAGAARPLPQTPRGIAAKNKHRSLDDNLTPMGQETDFTTLMAEYQKAKSDSKPPLNATNPERASQFDIPGLGQIKNTVHPTTGPKQHERNNRSHPNDRPRSPMPVSRRQRAVRQST